MRLDGFAIEGFDEMRYDTSENYQGFSDFINEYIPLLVMFTCVLYLLRFSRFSNGE
jgi:hypothetical protein